MLSGSGIISGHLQGVLYDAGLGEARVSDAEKKTAQDFYDQVGWKKVGGDFVDSLKFADRRPVAGNISRGFNGGYALS